MKTWKANGHTVTIKGNHWYGKPSFKVSIVRRGQEVVRRSFDSLNEAEAFANTYTLGR